ncbi:hypothetical protein ACHAXS_000868, partial [Conticribra weissflogii]
MQALTAGAISLAGTLFFGSDGARATETPSESFPTVSSTVLSSSESATEDANIVPPAKSSNKGDMVDAVKTANNERDMKPDSGISNVESIEKSPESASFERSPTTGDAGISNRKVVESDKGKKSEFSASQVEPFTTNAESVAAEKASIARDTAENVNKVAGTDDGKKPESGASEAELKSQIEKLEKEISDVKSKAQKEVESSKAEVKKMQKIVVALKAEMEKEVKLREEAGKAGSEQEAILQKKVDQLTQDIENIKTTSDKVIKEKVAQIEELKKSASMDDEKSKEIEAKLIDSRKIIDAKEAELAKMNKELDDMKRRNMETITNVGDEEKIKRLQQEVTSAQTAAEDAKKELKKIKANAAEVIKSKEVELKRVNDLVSSLQEQINQNSEEIDGLQQENKELKEKILKSNADIEKEITKREEEFKALIRAESGELISENGDFQLGQTGIVIAGGAAAVIAGAVAMGNMNNDNNNESSDKSESNSSGSSETLPSFGGGPGGMS